MRDDFGGLFAVSPGSLRRDPTPAEVAGGLVCGAAGRDFWNEGWFAISSILAELNTLLDAAGIVPDETAVNQVQQAILSLTKGRSLAHARVTTVPNSSVITINGSTNISSITMGPLYNGNLVTLVVAFATPMSNDRYTPIISAGAEVPNGSSATGSSDAHVRPGSITVNGFTIYMAGNTSGIYPDWQSDLGFVVFANP